jgi:hypothetical protein
VAFRFGSCGVILAPNLFNVDRWLRKLEVHRFHGGDDDLGDSEIAEPFVVSWDYEPWRAVGITASEGVLVGAEIVVPILSFGIVGFTDLPSLCGIVETLVEALELFFFADMQEELQDMRAIQVEAAFEVIDLVIALRPDGFCNQVVDPNDQNIFVLRAIEDSDFTLCGSLSFNAPQKIVSEFLLSRLFEVGYMAAIGIHRADDVLDDSIFAAGIEGLKDDQQRALAFGKEALLEIIHLEAKLFGFFQGFVLLVLSFATGTYIAEADVVAGSDAEVFHEALSSHCFSDSCLMR